MTLEEALKVFRDDEYAYGITRGENGWFLFINMHGTFYRKTDFYSKTCDTRYQIGYDDIFSDDWCVLISDTKFECESVERAKEVVSKYYTNNRMTFKQALKILHDNKCVYGIARKHNNWLYFLNDDGAIRCCDCNRGKMCITGSRLGCEDFFAHDWYVI